jgi:hypothetical protein
VTIRQRLVLFFSGVTIVAASLFGYIFVTEFAGGLRHSVLASLQTRTATLLQRLPDTASGPQIAQGSLGVADLAESQDVTQELTLGAKVLVALGPGTDKPLVGPATLRLARRSPQVLHISVGRRRTTFLLLVTATGQGDTFLVVGQSLATVDQAVSQLTMAVSVGGVLAVLATALAAWFLAGRALAPVERMRREASHISARDSDTALSVPPSNDELARLAVTLNDLLGRLHAAVERERGFSAAASHELRSPLAVLRAELQLAARPGRSPEYLSEAVRRATGEVDRVIDLANRLLLISQGDEDVVHLEMVQVDVRDIVQDTLASQSQKFEAAGVSVSLHAPNAVRARVDIVAYRRIVENLVENALRHAGSLHRLDVGLFPECTEVRLEVADDGAGFPPDFLPHAFERFSRADPSRSRQSGGAGLGLSLVAVLARAHGGRVQAANRLGGGAVVRVWIPTTYVAEVELSSTNDPTTAVANGQLSQLHPDREVWDAGDSRATLS